MRYSFFTPLSLPLLLIIFLIDIIFPWKHSLSRWPGAQLIVYIINNVQSIINNNAELPAELSAELPAAKKRDQGPYIILELIDICIPEKPESRGPFSSNAPKFIGSRTRSTTSSWPNLKSTSTVRRGIGSLAHGLRARRPRGERGRRRHEQRAAGARSAGIG